MWWYNGLNKGSPNTQPVVLTCVRAIENDEFADDFRLLRVPVAELGHFPIGSIWRGGSSTSSIARDEVTFDVNFSETGWECIRPGGALHSLIPESSYPLYVGRSHHESYLLRFRAALGSREVDLFIPCLEFFTRTYGASGYVRQVICTQPWDEEGKHKLIMPLPPEAPRDKWAVKLRRRSVNADVVFLAHLVHDPYALRVIRKIWAQLEASPEPEERKDRFVRGDRFIQAYPWMRGPGAIRVRGVWMQGQSAFLGLRILGASAPRGEDVERDRENTNNVGSLQEGADLGAAWRGVPSVDRRRNEIIDMTDDTLPEDGEAAVIVDDEIMEVLGEPRIVIDVRRREAQSTSGSVSVSPTAESHSSDPSSQADTGIGRATFAAPQKLESLGVLRDVWSFLLFLRRTYPDFILSVEHMTGSGSFSDDADPALLPFAPLEQDEIERYELRNRKWPYIDPRTMTPRGALVARVLTPTKAVYFLEIQRRVTTAKDDEEAVKEESFRGVVFTTDGPQSALKWITSAMRVTRYRQGAGLEDLPDPPGGMARAFVHRPAKQEERRQEVAIRRAFRLVGLDLPG